MAGSINKVILVGNLGADPEIKRFNDGNPLANLRIATTDTWRDKATGERKEKTEWHRVTVKNAGLAKVAEQYLKKGAKVYIEGQIETRKWTDQSGIEKYSTEVVINGYGGVLTMLDGKPADDAGNGRDDTPPSRNRYAEHKGREPQGGGQGSGRPRGSDDMDDNIPFAMEWR